MAHARGQLAFSDDVSRDTELREYGLDPSSDSPLLSNAAVYSALQNLVRLAAELCGAPYGVVNIISAEYQHQVGAWGVEAAVCPREDSMCAKVFLSREKTVVPDASQDVRFADNPFVTGEIGNVRFYASIPLETGTGFVPGTLCVFSNEPKELSPEQAGILEVLAKQVVELLELQRRTTQLDRTYAELKDTNAKLKDSNAKLAAFAGRVSHDLRIPLTTILGYAELVEDDPEVQSDSAAAKYLERIGYSGRRMLGMLEDVLSYSRVGGSIQPTHVSLQDTARNVARDLGIEGSGIIEAEDLTLYADKGHFRMLIQNLVSNAINYRSPERKLRIRITAVSDHRGATVYVADNGKGIKPEDRAMVLEPMFRLNRQGDGPGNGLGLATCHSIAEAHGGELSLSETPGGGTTVAITFPAGP